MVKGMNMPVDPQIITALLPLTLLLLDKEEDRQQIARLYLEYSRLMRKIAVQFFPESMPSFCRCNNSLTTAWRSSHE